MRLWIYAIGHMRGTSEGALCEDFCDRAGKLGRNMGFAAVTLEELPVSRHRDSQARMQDEARAAGGAPARTAPMSCCWTRAAKA